MPTAYTSLLGLALPVEGELSGTWGDVVNDSITSLLDSAVAGTTTLSTDADVTLTTTSGASNQARAAVLNWTATGTVTRTITAPAHSKAGVGARWAGERRCKGVGCVMAGHWPHESARGRQRCGHQKKNRGLHSEL